ncbi:hypothetical protein BH23ACT5_BH23ACT5_24210 [soil metagenome]
MVSNPNRVLLGAVGAVVLLAVAAVVVAALRPAMELDTATPEGTVQAYLQGLFDDDAEIALSFIDPDSGCTVEDIRSAHVPTSSRVVLLSTETESDGAVVEVRVTEDAGSGPFDSYEFSHEQEFSLRNDGDRWLISGEPWPLYICRGSSQ